jgi:hypothetical protein
VKFPTKMFSKPANMKVRTALIWFNLLKPKTYIMYHQL